MLFLGSALDIEADRFSTLQASFTCYHNANGFYFLLSALGILSLMLAVNTVALQYAKEQTNSVQAGAKSTWNASHSRNFLGIFLQRELKDVTISDMVASSSSAEVHKTSRYLPRQKGKTTKTRRYCTRNVYSAEMKHLSRGCPTGFNMTPFHGEDRLCWH